MFWCEVLKRTHRKKGAVLRSIRAAFTGESLSVKWELLLESQPYFKWNYWKKANPLLALRGLFAFQLVLNGHQLPQSLTASEVRAAPPQSPQMRPKPAASLMDPPYNSAAALTGEEAAQGSSQVKTKTYRLGILKNRVTSNSLSLAEN